MSSQIKLDAEHANEPVSRRTPFASQTARRIGTIASTGLALVVMLALASSAQAATAVGLGTADSFAVLGASGVTNTGPSVINGDLGTSPNPSVTGFGGAPNGTVNGSIHQADATAAQAQADLTTAYNNAAGQGPATTLATELGGQTLTPGVYNSASGTFGITGTLTLNAQGDPNAVFIFKTASTLITAENSQVQLINGAQACNVFWKVGSSATLGTNSTFVGNILALQSISLNSGVTVDGRLLALNGAVTLINDTVTRPQCATGGGTGGGGTGGGGTGGGGTGGGGTGGGGTGGGGTGGGGTGGGGTGGGGTGGGGGSATGGPPAIDISGVPHTATHGFKATVTIHDNSPLKTVKIFVDGKLVKQTTAKKISAFIKSLGLRSGSHTIRVVVVDVNGNRAEKTRKFRIRAAATTQPSFTG